MGKSLKIDFIWQGVTQRKDHWRDGLWAAMQILEKEFSVRYIEPTDIVRDDAILLYWEAPCTIEGPYHANYERVRNHPNKKILLFAGGPIKPQWVQGFDCTVVESKINLREFIEYDLKVTRAFGVNTDIFRPLDIPKQYKAVAHGTCASWKRQWLLCQALKSDALVFGKYQNNDTRPFDECRDCDSTVIDEVTYQEANKLLNKASVSVNCADFWGGGQRATLEAMACDLPVVVMTDSPKNREFVEEAGIGAIVEPDPNRIKEAVNDLIGVRGGRDYVLSKWTPKHYADNLKNTIYAI